MEDDCAGLADAALGALGHIDVLHNNVGVVPAGRTADLPSAEWRRGFEVNLTGMWLTCKYVLPHMRERGSGSVVNISSMAGLLAGGETIAYSTSKAAVHAMTRSLALEYAPHGVRVDALAPGMMDTPMAVDSVAGAGGARRDELAAARAGMVPMGHQGTSQDVADAALFLASDESAFITGVILPVDGGFTLRTGAAEHPHRRPPSPSNSS
ncbi:SDR family NAD(P)-dependent oxidoreductase [Streptomyces sp. NPDC002067]